VAGGQTVSIAATGLFGKDDTTILFGNQAAKILAIDPVHHTLVVRTPKGAKAGAVDVQLLTSKGSDVLVAGYSYQDAVTISAVSPSFGPPEGNTKLTITGSGFAAQGGTMGPTGATRGR